MTHRAFLITMVCTLFTVTTAGRAEDTSPRKIISLDADWRFTLGDPPGAEKPDFDDSAWRKLDVPHDWSIEGPIDPRNPSGTAQAFLPMGIGWYRKTITLPPGGGGGGGRTPTAGPRQILVEFDGIMANSTIYFNGHELGHRVSGYLPLRYEITKDLVAGKNVLAVRADNSAQPSSRWYAGSGITRHVRMLTLNEGFIRVRPGSAFVSTVRADATQATIKVQAAADHDPMAINLGAGGAQARLEIIDPTGRKVATTNVELPFDGTLDTREIKIDHPVLWGGADSEKAIYRAVFKIGQPDATEGEESIPFGIRTAEFKPDGFFLNGTRIQLRGVCLHLDGGGVGAAVPMGVWERRLDLLRSLGVNAIRTSHNPPDPAFLDLLDRKGFLVMHEIFDVWNTAKVRGDYACFFKDNWQQDLTDAVTRDRNHPCIVIYSAGNEIHDSAAAQLQLFPQIRDLYHQLDPTRPVTLAMLQADRPGNGFSNGLAQLQDVVGANYRPAQLVDFARQHPGTKVIETETTYNTAELQVFRDNPELSGEFVWTGVDYLGEGMGGIAQGFGMIDRTNQIRARGYEHQAWWTTEPMVKIARVIGPSRTNNRDLGGGRVLDWSASASPPSAPPPSAPGSAGGSPRPETLEVYSNADTVELFLNDQSLGTKTKPNTLTRTWQVPFAPGTLKAVAKNNGKIVATDVLRTAGPVTKLQLTADQKQLTTNWDDIAYVRASLVDSNGTINPNAPALIHFTLTGPGTIMAVDNADLDSHEPFRANQRTTFQGTCIAVIKATRTGPITVTASAEGLPDATVTIDGQVVH